LLILDGTLAGERGLKGAGSTQACVFRAEANHLIYADVMEKDWPTVDWEFFRTLQPSPD